MTLSSGGAQAGVRKVNFISLGQKSQTGCTQAEYDPKFEGKVWYSAPDF